MMQQVRPTKQRSDGEGIGFIVEKLLNDFKNDNDNNDFKNDNDNNDNDNKYVNNNKYNTLVNKCFFSITTTN